MPLQSVVDYLTAESFSPEVEAFVLKGSLVYGQADTYSDIDVDVIYNTPYYFPIVINNDAYTWDLQHFYIGNYPGYDQTHWNAGSFLGAVVVRDPRHLIRDIVGHFITLDETAKRAAIVEWLDSYYNGFYRSIKCLIRNNVLGSHVMACQSMEALNALLYALNGTIPAYTVRLPAMIKRLPVLPLEAEKLLSMMEVIAQTADGPAQYALLSTIKAYMHAQGYAYVYEDWHGELDAKYVILAQGNNQYSKGKTRA